MVVDFYAIDHGYGFCALGGDRVYFRVEDFSRGSSDDPLPICGEAVAVENVVPGSKTPHAMKVRRLTRPHKVRGRVKSFDGEKGWGFVTHGDDVYFLHRSDLTTTFHPVVGSEVDFYAGMRRGRLRACYVTPLRG